MCVFASVCLCTSPPPHPHFSLPPCVWVLRCEVNCEMMANAESENQWGEGHLKKKKKSSGETDVRVNTNARTCSHARTKRNAISSSLLCCWDAPNTYYISVCDGCMCAGRTPLPSGELSLTALVLWTSAVRGQHAVNILQTRAAKENKTRESFRAQNQLIVANQFAPQKRKRQSFLSGSSHRQAEQVSSK